jgi:hypothetical protein
MIDFSTKFPANATNVYWQKKKSFKDKTKKATKTGLGAELTKAEKAWNAIPWKQLDFRTVKPKPKTIQEAKQALAAAKQIQSTQVRAAIKAMETAVAKAKATGRNKALSDKAAGAAQGIEIVLNRAKVPLEKLKLDDLAGEIVRLETELKGRQSLSDIILRFERGFVASGQKGTIAADNSVTVAGLRWEPSLTQAPKTYKGKRLAVTGTRLDGSLFANDMVLASLSSDATKAKFK